MGGDLWSLYRQMLRSRRFEEAVARLWQEGKIAGEMHLGIGEEAVIAGVMAHIVDGDALAIDHRSTPPLVMRGVDLTLLLREFLGRGDGLCGGRGGHMHLFSPEHIAASSGIVGASGPVAAGFALATQHLRPGKVAVAFFGDGAMNQGMLMESMNLAVAWKLPVLFVCKDNSWAITTRSPDVSGGNLLERARSFGMPAFELDGIDVYAVWDAARQGIARARKGGGPSFLLAHCSRLEGHFLGDPLLRMFRQPVQQAKELTGPLLHSLPARKGASPKERFSSLGNIMSLIGKTAKEQYWKRQDPIERLRKQLKGDKSGLTELERGVKEEIERVLTGSGGI
ncbi:MAG: thiamine pyrophosphate-dependent dehydrogenase E1 component subunit alpha [Chloroflexi bacterium]|nr:thiamine pyrophosphate-dependent dehydrogenase E1 component subunit alpha [Chloroflexota bacterium]